MEKIINTYSLKKNISYLLTSNIVSFGIVFISSLLIFRNINRDDYGLYIIITSLFAIVELFMGGYNQSILRFLKEKISEVDKQQIILYTVYYKYAILLLFVLALGVMLSFDFMQFLINDYSQVSDSVNKYLTIAIISSFLSVLSGVSSTILGALYHYKITNNSMIIKNSIYLLCVVFLIFHTDEYLTFLYTSLALNVILFSYLSSVLWIKYPKYSLLKLLKHRLDFSIYKRYLFSYATPLTTISLLTYSKNHLPLLILGKTFDLEDVSIFSIMKKFFKVAHTISGSFLQPLLSKFIEIKNIDIQHYKRVMNKLFFAIFFMRSFLYISLLFLSNYFFLLYKIEISSLNSMIFAILGFEFIIAGIMTHYGTLLSTNLSTKYLLFTSVMRFILELLLIYFVLFLYGILGAAFILLVSRFFESLSAYYFVQKEKILKYDFVILLAITPFIIYFYMHVFGA